MSGAATLFDRDVDERTHLVEVEGKFDFGDGEHLTQRIIDLMYDGRQCFVVDLSAVDELDLRAITPLLRAAKRLSYRNGRLALVTSITSRLAESDLDRVLELAATQEDALATLAASGPPH
jgi:anti-anti-sigma regulatory factor